MNLHLKTYLNQHIIPIYDGFDFAHQSDHVKKVIFISLEIAKDYEVDINMVYTIACYHDIGMQFGRDNHHLTGGLVLYNDQELKTYFSEEHIKTMQEAVEDHRASNDEEPRTIYGKIIAEADRDIDVETVCTRTIQFGFKHYPHLSIDEHIERAYDHIVDKYGPNGYLKLWLHTKHNQNGLKEIHQKLKNVDEMKAYVKNIYLNIKKT
jgi:uncharacterized protein